MDKASNIDVEEKLTCLDVCEKRIYDQARKSAVDFSEWQTRKLEKLTPSNTAVNLAKRKFDSIAAPLNHS